MITLFIISSIICIGYAIFIYSEFSVSSISESYYMFEKRKKGLGMIFYGWSILTSITLLPLWLEITPNSFQFIPFLSSISLIAVGCFPDYKNEHNKAHSLSALFAGVLSILWGIFVDLWIIPVLSIATTSLVVLIISFFKKGNLKENLKGIGLTFWVELSAFVSIYLCVLYKILN